MDPAPIVCPTNADIVAAVGRIPPKREESGRRSGGMSKTPKTGRSLALRAAAWRPQRAGQHWTRERKMLTGLTGGAEFFYTFATQFSGFFLRAALLEQFA